MTQLIDLVNPEYSKPTWPEKIWSFKYGYHLVIILLTILLASVIFLLIHEYYTISYKLTDLLPNNYALAIEFNNNEDSLPKIQAEEFLNQPTFKKIYQASKENINSYLNLLPQEIQPVIKKTKQALFFLSGEKDFGLIIKLSNKKEAEKIKAQIFQNLHYQIINKQILVLTSNPELLEKITTKQIKPLSPFNFSISLNPWLTFYLQDEFFKQKFENNILADLQTILLPLESTEQKNFQLEFITKPHQLILNLNPKVPVFSKLVGLDNYFNFQSSDYDIIFGLNDLDDLMAEMEKNNSLKKYFEQADSLLWLKSQISLSWLSKELRGPVIISLSKDKWQITTDSANQGLFDGILKNYLAEFKPEKQTITLPDGTKAVELIANPSAIAWETAEQDGWQVFKANHPQKMSKIGYAIKENILIFSNKIENMTYKDYKNNCFLPNISSILSISDPDNKLFNSDLLNFSSITTISSVNGQIKACFNLK